MAFPETSQRIMAVIRVFRIAGARVAVASVAAVSFSAGNTAYGSWALYSEHELFDVHLGMYKPIIWARRESDTNADPSDPTQSGGVYRFDLKEIVSESTYPTGVNLSVNFFGIVEPRFSFEWFTFKYHSYDLSFNGAKVDRKDYTFDLLMGYDVNKMNPHGEVGMPLSTLCLWIRGNRLHGLHRVHAREWRHAKGQFRARRC